MARKWYSDEECLKILRQVGVEPAAGADVATACRSAGISDATFYTWRKKFGSMGRSQLSELKALEKENQKTRRCRPTAHNEVGAIKRKARCLSDEVWCDQSWILERHRGHSHDILIFGNRAVWVRLAFVFVITV